MKRYIQSNNKNSRYSNSFIIRVFKYIFTDNVGNSLILSSAAKIYNEIFVIKSTHQKIYAIKYLVRCIKLLKKVSLFSSFIDDKRLSTLKEIEEY